MSALPRPGPVSFPLAAPRSPRAAALAAAGAAYAGLVLYRIRTIPGGITNDAAEEALRGLALVEGRRLEVITFVLGQSLETLWLYVMGFTAKIVGTSVLAVALPSAAAAAATVVLVTLLVRRLEPGIPRLVPFLLIAGSPWLFHYGRSGFRAIAAPLFLALSAFLLARAGDDPGRRPPYFLAGAAAGLSVYAYTACRLLPPALVLALLVAAFRDRARRGAWVRAGLAAVFGILLVSIPNLVFLASRPADFLSRGAYIVMGTPAQRLSNLVASAFLPLDYPHRYRYLWGDGHMFDAVSAELSGSGMDPIPLPAGVLVAAGLVLALWRRRDVATLYLVFTLALVVFVLGPLGPSLTRLLVALPAYAVFASLAAGALAARGRAWRAGTIAGLALLAALSLGSYVARFAHPAHRPGPDMSLAQTAMGERAAAVGGRVVCVVRRFPNVVRYLAHGRDVTVFEFHERPFDVREVLPALPAPTLLVERDPLLEPWRPDGYVESEPRDPGFRELRPAGATPPTGP